MENIENVGNVEKMSDNDVIDAAVMMSQGFTGDPDQDQGTGENIEPGPDQADPGPAIGIEPELIPAFNDDIYILIPLIGNLYHQNNDNNYPETRTGAVYIGPEEYKLLSGPGKFCTDDRRRYLQGIHFTPEKSEITNGHFLIQIGRPGTGAAGGTGIDQDLNQVDPLEGENGTILHFESMKSLVPSMKSFKGPGKYSEDHEIEINYKEYAGGVDYIGHQRGVTNCAESRIRETEDRGTFPDTESVCNIKGPHITVQFNAAYLAELAKYIDNCGARAGVNTVVLEIPITGENDGPIILRGRNEKKDRVINCLIMPLRNDGDNEDPETDFIKGPRVYLKDLKSTPDPINPGRNCEECQSFGKLGKCFPSSNDQAENCKKFTPETPEEPEPVKPVKRGRRKKNQDPIDPGTVQAETAPDQDQIDPGTETKDPGPGPIIPDPNKGYQDEMSNCEKSFFNGYNLVKAGTITGELSPREIIDFYDPIDPDAFYQGTADALGGDNFRYNLMLQKLAAARADRGPDGRPGTETRI